MDSEKESKNLVNEFTQPNVDGLYTALDLMELGIELVRQRYVREHPDAGEEAIRKHINVWLQTPRSCATTLNQD
jgi:hypothetical protein